jgi:hypothetical protein
MIGARAAWAIAGLDVAVILGVWAISPTLGLQGGLVFTFGVSSFAGVGALLCARVPSNPIGSMLLASGTLMAGAMLAGAYHDIGSARVPAWVGSDAATVIQTSLFVPPFFLALAGIPLVFPDGHLPSRRFRWVAGMTVAGLIFWPAASIVRAIIVANRDDHAVSLQLEPLLQALEALFFVAAVVCFGAGVIAVGLRFRRGNRVERQQIKWLFTVASAGAAVLPLSFVASDPANPMLGELLANLSVLILFALPLVVAAAVLRYRLYDIDRIISRTIGWAIVTTALLGAFAGAVLVLQAALAGVTQGQTLAVAGSTLLAFALFQPLRRRVQGAVDHRFDRARYDAQQTVDAFAERLRSEVNLETVRLDLVTTTIRAVRPDSSAVWLRNATLSARS